MASPPNLHVPHVSELDQSFVYSVGAGYPKVDFHFKKNPGSSARPKLLGTRLGISLKTYRNNTQKLFIYLIDPGIGHF